MEYSTKHKMLIQAIMWYKCIRKCDLLDLMKNLDLSISSLDNFIGEINNKINRFKMQISSGIDDESGETYFALIPNRDNNLNKLSLLYTIEEIEIFKKILEFIITQNGICEKDKLVRKLLQENVKIKFASIDSVIKEFVNEKYLTYLEDEIYGLGIRGCIEFESYFRIYYSEFLEECYLCKLLCFKPVKCKNCSSLMHKICAKNIAESSSSCLTCNQALEYVNLETINLEDANYDKIIDSQKTNILNEDNLIEI